MGCCCSSNAISTAPPEARTQENYKIEEDLLKQRLEQLFTFKILLLGAGESGKTTIMKQLRLIHNKKPTKHELDMITESLHQNVIDCMRSLIQAATKFGLELADEEDQKTAEAVMVHEQNVRITVPFANAILKLYASEPIKQAYARRGEFWLLDSCPYYMDNLMRFVEEDFTPTEDDVLLARIRTTGIVETQLEQKIANPKEDEPGTIKFKVVDVGGQRNERKKWIHCFDDVKAILFIVNLNAYDQVLFEDSTKNRLVESLELFHEITHKQMFYETPIVLFLNKKDLFEKMITEKDLSEVLDSERKQVFPDYTGGRNLKPALDYIEARFKAELPKGKNVDVQIVTGVVKKDIKYAFDDVKKALYEANRKKIDAEKKSIKLDAKRNLRQVDVECGCL